MGQNNKKSQPFGFIKIPDFLREDPAPRHTSTTFKTTKTARPPQFRRNAQAARKKAAFTAKLRVYGLSIAGFTAAAAIVALVARYSSADFTAIVTALLALCGLIAYDVISRQKWEKTLSTRIETLSRNHDRLVREVARNRSELAGLKQNLAQAAHAAEAHTRRLPAAGTAEARMLETIVTRLSNLSDVPRPEIETPWDDEILELQLAPPPQRALPASALDHELHGDPDRLPDEQVRTLLQTAVRRDHIDVFVQPIVSLPQRKARMMEVFGRIRAGDGHLSAARYMRLAREAEIIPALDNLLLLRCLQMLRDSRDDIESVPCVVNVAADTLHDAGFMNDLVAFLSEHKKLATRLIFELPQYELLDMDPNLAPVLEGLTRLGCRFSMDRVQNRRLNISRLRGQHLRFIKLDAQWLIREAAAPGGVGRIRQLKKQLDSAGIDLVVEKIETEDELRELLDFSVDFGQGYLFARPAPATSNALSARRAA